MMNKMQLNRIAIEKGEEYLLVMHLGETYRDAFLELLDIAEEGIRFIGLRGSSSGNSRPGFIFTSKNFDSVTG